MAYLTFHEGVFEDMGNHIKQNWDKMTTVTSDIGHKTGLSKVGEGLAKVASGVAKGIGTAANAASEFTGKIGQGLRDAQQNAADRAANAPKEPNYVSDKHRAFDALQKQGHAYSTENKMQIQRAADEAKARDLRNKKLIEKQNQN